MRWADTRRTSTRDGVLEEAFDAAFRALDPGHERRTPEEWEWRTERAPGGAPFVTLRDDAGAVLAHYGALGQAVRVHGQLLRAGQAVDTFAGAQLAPRARAAAFQAACEAFMEEHCGVGAGEAVSERFAFCFGFPVRPAWRLGRAGLGYSVLQEFLRLTRPVREAGTARWDLDLALDAPWPTDLSDHFAREAPAVAFDRGPAFLRWRFEQRPGVAYTRVLLSRGGACAAWAVLRERQEGATRVGVLVDRFVPLRDEDAAWALEAVLDECARARGWTALALALGEADPELARLQQRGWRPAPTPYALVGRSFDARAGEDLLARELRWTLADTDLA